MSYTEEEYQSLLRKSKLFLKEGTNLPFLERDQVMFQSPTERARYLRLVPAYQRISKELNLPDDLIVEPRVVS